MDKTLYEDKWPFTPDLKKFAEFLGLNATLDAKGVNWDFKNRIERKLKTVYEYGKSLVGNDIVDIMYAVRQIQKKTGTGWTPEESLNKVFGWITLDTKHQQLKNEETKILKEKELYEVERREEDGGRNQVPNADSSG